MDFPTTKLEAVKFLAECEKDGVKIRCTEGSQWRMLSPVDLLECAQRIYREHCAHDFDTEEGGFCEHCGEYPEGLEDPNEDR